MGVVLNSRLGVKLDTIPPTFHNKNRLAYELSSPFRLLTHIYNNHLFYYALFHEWMSKVKALLYSQQKILFIVYEIS